MTVYSYDNVGKVYETNLKKDIKDISFTPKDCKNYKIVEAESLGELVECVCVIMKQEKMVPIGGITVIDNPHHSRVYVQALYKAN